MLTGLKAGWAAIPSKVKWIGAIALAVAAILMLTYCTGRDAGRAGIEREIDKANIEVLEKQGIAVDKASEDRLLDAKVNAQAKEELIDAVEDLPDAVPSERRIALGCARLRAQGTDTSGIPACSGR